MAQSRLTGPMTTCRLCSIKFANIEVNNTALLSRSPFRGYWILVSTPTLYSLSSSELALHDTYKSSHQRRAPRRYEFFHAFLLYVACRKIEKEMTTSVANQYSRIFDKKKRNL